MTTATKLKETTSRVKQQDQEGELNVPLVLVMTLLCLVCCVLFLLFPTQSISPDTVYQGF